MSDSKSTRQPSMKARILILLTVLFAQAVYSQTGTFQWPDNKKAAICLTFDDGLDCHLDKAIPLLDSFNVKGTFYCTAYSSSLGARIPEWRKAAAEGHELGNHTLFHPCDGRRNNWVRPEYDLSNYSREEIRDELRTANTLLKAIDGREERTFAYSCGDYRVAGDSSFVDIVQALFPAARNTVQGLPSSMNSIDLHFVPSRGMHNKTGQELIHFAEEAREKGTMAVFMFHSVGGGYLNIPTEALRELLQYLNDHSGDYWVDSFYNVTRYIASKQQDSGE
ncbi:MAG: chitooligosaccharide deacetylase [Bacteroidetes bacterium]|nr:MAG: chitooligosaccharide deacetylase [Bacteroidota bacterium]